MVYVGHFQVGSSLLRPSYADKFAAVIWVFLTFPLYNRMAIESGSSHWGKMTEKKIRILTYILSRAIGTVKINRAKETS